MSIFVAIDIGAAFASMDSDKIEQCLSKYFKVVSWILEMLWKIVSLTVQFIGGIIP